jgi:hypothetical protein
MLTCTVGDAPGYYMYPLRGYKELSNSFYEEDL